MTVTGIGIPRADQALGMRKRQEDSVKLVRLNAEAWLAIVADGMGGEAGGDIASRIAVNEFASAYRDRDDVTTVPRRLSAALEAANAAIVRRIREQPELEGMGTTLVAVTNDGGEVHYISVGDSPLWEVSRSGLRRINEDHSMRSALRRMVKDGEMTEAQAARHPHRNQLRSVLGDEDLEEVDCPAEPLGFRDGGILLLATDGIETLNEREIHGIVAATAGDSDRAIARLLKAVADAGEPRQDNVSICLWPLGKVAAGKPVTQAPPARKRFSALAWSLVAAAAVLVVALGWWLYPRRAPAPEATVSTRFIDAVIKQTLDAVNIRMFGPTPPQGGEDTGGQPDLYPAPNTPPKAVAPSGIEPISPDERHRTRPNAPTSLRPNDAAGRQPIPSADETTGKPPPPEGPVVHQQPGPDISDPRNYQ